MERSSAERKFAERPSSSRKPTSARRSSAPGMIVHGENKLRSESLRAVVLADDTTVRWSEQDIPEDSGCVRATVPVPRDTAHFCFEVTIVQGGEDITIGLGKFDGNGVRSLDAGYTFSSKTGLAKAMATTRKYSTFRDGDVITCGVSFFRHSVDPFVYFALNGDLLEPFLPWNGKKSSELFPFVSTLLPGAMVKIVYDEALQVKWSSVIREVEIERERKRLSDIRRNVDLEPICERVVRDFLLHHGYVETLRAMDEGIKHQPDTGMEVEEDSISANAMHSTNSNSRVKATKDISRRNSSTSKSTKGDDVKRIVESNANGTVEAKSPKAEVNGTFTNGNERNEKANDSNNSNSVSNGKVPSISSASSSNVRKRRASDALMPLCGLSGAAIELAKERRKVRTLVLDGKPVEAMKVVEERWPDVLSTSPVALDLRIQCLVELIMARRYRDAIALARAELWPYLKPHLDELSECGAEGVPPPESPEVSLVKRALGLFALPDLSTPAAQAKLSHLDRRRAVADTLNRVLLYHPDPPKSPALERILAKMNEFYASTREQAGGYGVLPSVESDEDFQL